MAEGASQKMILVFRPSPLVSPNPRLEDTRSLSRPVIHPRTQTASTVFVEPVVYRPGPKAQGALHGHQIEGGKLSWWIGTWFHKLRQEFSGFAVVLTCFLEVIGYLKSIKDLRSPCTGLRCFKTPPRLYRLTYRFELLEVQITRCASRHCVKWTAVDLVIVRTPRVTFEVRNLYLVSSRHHAVSKTEVATYRRLLERRLRLSVVPHPSLKRLLLHHSVTGSVQRRLLTPTNMVCTDSAELR